MEAFENSSAARLGDGEAGLAQATYEKIRLLISRHAVVVFTIGSCSMCHVVKHLLFGLGVAPTVVEIDRDTSNHYIHNFLFQFVADSNKQPIPAVFVGGKFLGGTEVVMACHINGTLVPLLKEAGALWL